MGEEISILHVCIHKNIAILLQPHIFIVYTLWKIPNIVPSLIIHPPVAKYILGGAGLFGKVVTLEYSSKTHHTRSHVAGSYSA
jgi:hypothetical protein